MRTVMKHDFSRAPQAEIPRSSFDRSHGYKTTFDAGYLIPFFVDEVLPGDTFKLTVHALARVNTLIYPMFDNAYLETHFFYVPNRLVWDNFQKFMGEQVNPNDSIDYTVPVLQSTTFTTGSIGDYLGLPIGVAIQPSALPFRAINLVYNEWFRDENLQNSLTVDKSDGPDTTSYALFRRGKRHDYFTSALPWPQKGDPVYIPTANQAPIKGLGIRSASSTASWNPVYETDNSSPQTITGWKTAGSNTPSAGESYLIVEEGTSGLPGIYADLTAATATTINDLRLAFATQKLLERDARGGTRYREILKAHFGVTSPDLRLQVPEYLGGGSAPLNVTSVPQTNSTDSTSPQANLASFGTVNVNHHGFNKSFVEHGYIIGFVSVRADLTYQQGMNRLWNRSTRYDFYWPALSHIGEQSVLNKEIYTQGTTADDSVFGYQERYAEYRYKPSMITGKMRSDATGSLDAWHLSQDFASLPTLGATFIEETPPFDRVVAVPTEPDFLLDAYFEMRCARPMPMYGVPGFTDHF